MVEQPALPMLESLPPMVEVPGAPAPGLETRRDNQAPNHIENKKYENPHPLPHPTDRKSAAKYVVHKQN
ncbi:hypothetical protein LH935_05120 [Gordonia polyisoprenivorans]|uniref:hypothetical protein n=1 Tax=Gordonia polyisoprenivorans TaxID=84595 RepID=UPI0022345D09|nr:hypothetical protein LH935_05120 [Gordonia polyisoprenivorans]